MKEKRIVFVTVGTDPQQFDRLLKEIDRLIEKGFFSLPVFCQTGYSTYVPKNAESKAFLELKEFEAKIKQAELVVSHGGAGSIGTVMQHGKKCVAVPRLEKYGEHANDHQLELVEALEKAGMVLAAYDEKKLGEAIQKAEKWKSKRFQGGKKIIELLEGFVQKNF